MDEPQEPFQAHGLWWPPNLGADPEEFMRQAEDVDAAVELCTQRRTVVQAGGHVGAWARQLVARAFELVFVFEPSWANYKLLISNTGLFTMVEPYRGLLGAQRGYGSLCPGAKNSGAGHAAFDGRGPLTVHTVDQFAFDDLDLLCLDVEGSELFALQGAEDTIARCKPVILYEERGHGAKYGHTPQDIERWLTDHGYKYARRVRKDRIWVPT